MEDFLRLLKLLPAQFEIEMEYQIHFPWKHEFTIQDQDRYHNNVHI
jgi:hypothetical protein